ncbi:MAG: recombinase family protein [Pirellulaceae bacterium]
MNVAIYTRTPFGSDDQRQRAEEFVARNGWHCRPERYDDADGLDQPALERLLDDVQAGGIDCVVVCDLTRFSRSPAELQHIRELLTRHDVSLVEVDP